MLPRAVWARERVAQQNGKIDLPRDVEGQYGTFSSKMDPQLQSSSKAGGLEYEGKNWMAFADDETLISALTLPGTHDSAACKVSWPFVQTQGMDIRNQLNAGIRYFDLRCGVRNDIVEMVHGPSILGITLSTVLDVIYTWLESHTTEALVVQIKQDRKSERSRIPFAVAIANLVTSTPERWRTGDTTPALGELRGRIQLLRRFLSPNPHAFGIDVMQWPDNPPRPFTIHTWHEFDITIQDHYTSSHPKSLSALVRMKGGDVVDLLTRAAADQDEGNWYINFSSAYEFNFYHQLTPKQISLGGYSGFRWEEGMNSRLRNFLATRPGRQRFGIVAMDFPEGGAEDLILTLIQSNFESQPPRRTWLQLVIEGLLWAFAVFLLIMAATPVTPGRPSPLPQQDFSSTQRLKG
ncbi:PLC-like phosphodiesterase [Hortaea werneckii]|nr:PLC-like phosphodiesterase [Hortaea werneckii]